MLETLVQEKITAPVLLDQFEKLIKEFRNLKGKRNGIVHAMWLPASNKALNPSGRGRKPTPNAAKTKARGKLDFELKPIPAKDIEALASQIAEAAQEGFFLAGWVAEHPKRLASALRSM